MSNPVSYITNVVQLSQTLVSAIEYAQQLTDMTTQDPTLATRYFGAPTGSTGTNIPTGATGGYVPPSPGARTDIVAADITNALSALTQIAFTFNSGSPTQKSYLYKLLP